MPTHDHPRPEPLERRPEARTVRVEDLLADVKRGRVRIPAFQRGFRWQRDDAVELLDSIYRGYPIGTLLLWETQAEAQVFQLGSLSIRAASRPDAWWVVDGQQRVVSLVRVLLAQHPSADEFALYFDLDELRFVASAAVKHVTADPSRWLPLAVVLDSEDLFRWMLELQPQADRRERAVRVGKRVREYEFPAYVVRTDSEATLRDIFGRSNNSGKRLEAGEVFDALHGARTSLRPATLGDIVDELDALGFGRVEQKILYRLLRVLSGADVTDRAGKGVLRLTDEQARTAYAETAAASRSVIQFLKDDVGIPHYALLPYKQPLVTLGKFFHHHPTPLARSRELLVRWLWRGALNGAHRGDTVSTRRALDQIDGQDEEQSVQRMLGQVSAEPSEWPAAREPFNFRFALGKLQTLALLDLAPRSLADGSVLKVEDLLARADDGNESPLPGIVPATSDGLERSVANRLLHPRQHGLRRLLASATDEAVLTTHAIDAQARSALAQDDVPGFLDRRASKLERHFGLFFSERARWGASDRPSVQSLIVAEED